ncbi:MAG: hypothetical protein MJ129_05450 [Clostridia bacterium]|nr:hypothetical protein [Clostridia bacterium]
MANSVEKLVKKAAGNMNTKERSEYYNFGFKYFGPFLLGFTRWLEENIEASGAENVFFFARDGYTMQKAYALLHDGDCGKYVYFSRKSLRQALLWKSNSYAESLTYLTYARYVSVAALLEYYGFSEEERADVARACGVELDLDLEYATLADNEVGRALYEANVEVIAEKSREQFDLLRDYLEQIGMEGEVAIVDIGWIGSMQYALETFIRENNMDITVHGFYVGINPEHEVEGTVAGYLYNPDDLGLRKSLLCFFGGLEKLFQSLEGSTEGYRRSDGTIVPKLGRYEYADDAQVRGFIREWQQGALDFVEAAKAASMDGIALQDLAMPLVEFGKNPPLWGVKLFKFFYNIDGNKQYFVSRKPLYKYGVRELMHALSNSVWKTGFMKSVFKLPLPYYKVYELLRK